MNEGARSNDPAPASQTRRWSVAGRTTWWFGITTALLVLVICAISGAFLTRSSERQIDALIEEELKEFAAAFEVSSQTVADADAIAAKLAERSANPMAWRIWDRTTHELWHQAGCTEMLTPSEPAPEIRKKTSASSSARRWRCAHITERYDAGLMLDGADRMAMLHGFGTLSFCLACISGLIAFGAGAMFIRRSCRLLRDVGEKVRNVHVATNATDLDVPNAPDEIRDIVEALQQALANIRVETDRARTMTTGIAHELGAPLQNLIGETEVALLAERTPDEYKNVLKSHLEDLRDLGRAVGNLMTLWSLENGVSGDVENFDLGRETELRLQREYAHAERRGVHLEVVQTGDLSLSGDREALLLAVINVVTNAIDWAPAGGDVKVSLSSNGGIVNVTVDDSGPGVPDKERVKIFEPFHCGVVPRGKRAGYGLGLSIAKKAVETQGGSVEIARSPQGGARFTLHLPCVRHPQH